MAEYIDTRHDKYVVDPDPNKIYSKRKERQTSQLHGKKTTESFSVKLPNDRWSTKVERLPMFTKAEMGIHTSKTAKKLYPRKEKHSVPTGLQKAKPFLTEYLQDIKKANDRNFFMLNPCVTTVLKRMIHQIIQKLTYV